MTLDLPIITPMIKFTALKSPTSRCSCILSCWTGLLPSPDWAWTLLVAVLFCRLPVTTQGT